MLSTRKLGQGWRRVLSPAGIAGLHTQPSLAAAGSTVGGASISKHMLAGNASQLAKTRGLRMGLGVEIEMHMVHLV